MDDVVPERDLKLDAKEIPKVQADRLRYRSERYVEDELKDELKLVEARLSGESKRRPSEMTAQ